MNTRWNLTLYRVYHDEQGQHVGTSQTRFSGKFESVKEAHDYADENWHTHDCNTGEISSVSGVGKIIWQGMERTY